MATAMKARRQIDPGAPAGAAPSPSLCPPRRRTRSGEDPFDGVEWEIRDAIIAGAGGEPVFEQRSVEIPAFWSQPATNVVVSKYFRGGLGTPQRETSARQMIGRVVTTLTEWGRRDGYLEGSDGEVFGAELTHLLLHQVASFNSPVWFNVGIEERPQCSACFINSVDDSLESIMDLAKTEAMLFKYGSGSGSNLSSLRSAKEALSGGGTSSGPVSFMRGLDAFAGVVKSGGKTRRAAKMVILNADHPDIVEFVRSKELEERKAWALIEAGFDGGFDAAGGAYDSVSYQNGNHSVRVSDEFMTAVSDDGDWVTRGVRCGEPMATYRARDLLAMIAESAWLCGDPGMQFDSTINRWHTCPASGRIEASNPCSEFMFLDDSACNLASLNLLRFHDEERGFDVEGFRHACEILILAMEIMVGAASYPTPRIAANSVRFRPLGLGYANLGALLMALALPYASEEGRAVAAAITALLTGAAYAQSSRIAARLGPFEGFAENREPMLAVLRRHRSALDGVDPAATPDGLVEAARRCWNQALDLSERDGLRNAQVSVLAPTGTIALMMDCATTGIEPDIALVKHKNLVGGGVIKMVNGTVPLALRRLGYEEEKIRRIVEFLDENGGLEGAPGLDESHLPIFDCAIAAGEGTRALSPAAHLGMMAAVQPFLSGAISKTVNLPGEATSEDIFEVFVEAWKQGLKSVAVYRDGSKRVQALRTGRSEERQAEDQAEEETSPAKPVSRRRRLPDERRAVTHKFSVAGHEGYVTVGLFDDGSPGELFLTVAKEGSTISGLMDAFATAISIALQYGVPLETLVDKFSHTRFEPSGFTNNPQIPLAKSITDYLFRWLASKFLDRDQQAAAGILQPDDPLPGSPGPAALQMDASRKVGKPAQLLQQDAPSCRECGAIMMRNGSCYACPNCGATTGCG